MKPEKILEIARRYTVPKKEGSILVEFNEHNVPTPTGETMSMMMWSFCEEELVAFAQSVIEADRESSDEPVAWAYITKDCKIVHYEFVEGLVPLYRRPAPARKPLTDKEIESVLSNHRFAYGVDITAYSFARAVEKKVLEKMHGIGETK